MDRLTTKCSIILIATGEEINVYRSMEEIPAHLRSRMAETTAGENAATILIFDRQGREELLKAARRAEEDERYAKLIAALMAGAKQKAASRPARLRDLLPALGQILLAGCVGYVLWTLTTLYW